MHRFDLVAIDTINSEAIQRIHRTDESGVALRRFTPYHSAAGVLL